MEKKLFEVRVEVISYAAAENATAAEDLIISRLDDAVGDWMIEAREITTLAKLSSPWHDGVCIPYGDNEDLPATEWQFRTVNADD